MTTVSDAEKRTDGTDIQPATIHLGIDTAGAHHVYRSATDLIHIIDPVKCQRTAVVAVGGRDLEGWMQDIAATRGWLNPEYGVLSVDTDKFRPRGF